MRRRDLLGLGLAAVSIRAGVLRAALAQTTYPERPIRLVIPFPPGGGYDAVGRPWAEKITPLLGTIVVENQGGGGSSLVFTVPGISWEPVVDGTAAARSAPRLLRTRAPTATRSCLEDPARTLPRRSSRHGHFTPR